MRLCRTVLLTLVLGLSAGSLAYGQVYPVKTIRIVTTAPGAANDLFARMIAQGLTNAFNRQVIVENKGGGILAIETVAKAPPDGYTIVFASAGNIAISPGLYGAKLPFNPETDLAPVTLVASTTQILIAHPSLPAKSVKELIALAKAKPNSLDYASAGNGSTPHLNMVLLASMAGIKLNGIVFKGSTPGRLAVVAGEVPLMVDGMIPSLPLIQSGRLRALGVTSAKRSAALPNVPAIAETVPGYLGEIWYGVLAPAATPKEIIARLHAEIVNAFRGPDVKARFANQGADIVANTPAEFGAFIRTEIVKWTKLIRDSGAKVD